jgi:outer membrane putative beta-barrel porin/alpha-amylase
MGPCQISVRCRFVVALLIAWSLASANSEAQQPASPSPELRQSLDDAWWTGPMLAPSAATLPRGHFLLEPYLYDVMATHSNGFGSLTYMNYGLRDKLTVGLIPTAGFNQVSNGPSSSGIGLGDLTVQTQYRLTNFNVGHWIPTTSIAVQQALPTGKYDRLSRPSDGLGNGAYTTTLALYSQTYFWLPNGRILRMRFNATQSLSKTVKVEDVSVYGTQAGFRGHAKPGGSSFVDVSGEYSLTRKWVLALDATYRHTGNTRTAGYDILSANRVPSPSSIRLQSGSSDTFAFAPAIEYNWSRNLGVLLGTRVIPASHNTSPSITPAVAINFVH